MRILCVLTFMLFPISSWAQIKAGRPLVPERAQKLVVSLRLPGAKPKTQVTGSGYLHATDNWTYVVTAKHVLEPLVGGQVEVSFHLWPESGQIHPEALCLVDLSKEAVGKSIFLSATRDVALIRLARFTGTSTVIHPENVRWVSQSTGTTLTIVAQEAGSVPIDGVEITEPVVMIGFPSSVNSYLDPAIAAYDDGEPLFRSAIVAGKNKSRGVLIIDGMSHPGNSGGPVLLSRSDGLYVAGIVTELMPSISVSKNERGIVTNVAVQNAGYSVVEPYDSIKALLIEAELGL